MVAGFFAVSIIGLVFVLIGGKGRAVFRPTTSQRTKGGQTNKKGAELGSAPFLLNKPELHSNRKNLLAQQFPCLLIRSKQQATFKVARQVRRAVETGGVGGPASCESRVPAR
ncbi:hypothetical protein SAMN05216595_5302 [Rhizobium sp. AN6A]|nr:hypothetical protein SAMN05216595_5302 [Rhizobium sp. AN6A]